MRRWKGTTTVRFRVGSLWRRGTGGVEGHWGKVTGTTKEKGEGHNEGKIKAWGSERRGKGQGGVFCRANIEKRDFGGPVSTEAYK